MKIPAMTFVVLALVSLIALFTAGDACGNIPSLRREEACFKACNTAPQLYNLCRQTLQGSPDSAEVAAYAVTAARNAKWSYDATVAKASQMMAGGGAPQGERDAYLHCIDRYAVARVQMANVVDEMANCDFGRARQEYLTAVGAVETCGSLLSAFKSSPVAAMNAADRDLTMVAYDLGALIVGK
ncbi:hypothetical protein ACP70R_003514 [Stipagrostis hirtigluma subsp. patula]